MSSGKSAGSIAKDRGWPSSSVRQCVAAIKLRTLARRRAPRSWSQLACALAWTVLATCSLRTSSRLRRRSTLRATKTRTTIRGRRRSAVLTLSSNRTGPQLVPLVLCLGRCSVKLLCGRSLARFVPKRQRFCGVYGSLSSFRSTQRTPRRHAQPSSRPTRRSPVTRSST